MAPKFSSSSNKDKKTIDYAEDGIQETTMALSLVTAAAELAPTPYLRRAAGTTLKIINTAHVRTFGSQRYLINTIPIACQEK